MSEFKVSVVIPVWNQWEFTKVCLDTLRPTLGVRDEVIVVDNGSTDQTAKGLRNYSWLKVVTNEENQGFGRGCNQGAAVATGDVIIFLNNDTILTTRWIDGLVWPFEDDRVVATGPRSNSVSGKQLVQNVDYDISRMSSYRQWARGWREAHKREITQVERLIGFCIAVRRSDFEALGGFDERFEIGGFEDDDLCVRLLERGQLLICHESFVHHVGHVTFDGSGIDWFELQDRNQTLFDEKHNMVSDRKRSRTTKGLLSACMIVKDEADNLSRCLSSLDGAVDEVVVYDTGSTDNTVEIAKAAGAKVIEGYWDNDFGRARNAALEHCSGQWILHIDADEILECNPIAFRQELQATRVSSMVVEVDNLSDNGKQNLTHRPCRLFRRESYHWVGRLHEQVTMRDGNPRPEVGIASTVRIVHFGYLTEAIQAKKKAERNLAIAEMDAQTDNGRDQVDKLTNLGRSMVMVGREEEGYACYVQARGLETDSPVIRRTLLRSGAQSAINLERPEEALDWLEELEKYCEYKDTLHLLRGWAYANMKEWTSALQWLDRVGNPMRDDDSFLLSGFLLGVNRAKALAGLERWDEAADILAPEVTKDAHDEPVWSLFVTCFWKAGRDFGQVFNELDRNHINAVFGQLATVEPEAADAVLEALWPKEECRANVLALAIRVAPALSVDRALDWSVRLREHGLEEQCPLIDIGFNSQRRVAERLRASAVAFTAFNDDRAVDCIRQAAQRLMPESFATALAETSAIAPQLLEPLVLATATNPPRCLAMGKALFELGAADEGVAVVLHGRETDPSEDWVADAAKWLESVGRSKEAAGLSAK